MPSKTKVAISIDTQVLRRVDQLVGEGRFSSRSQALEVAVTAHLERLDRSRLAAECAKLDPAAERALAEEGMGADAPEWPEY